MGLPLAFVPKEAFMEKAIALGREAAAAGEIPVGAVVVSSHGEILGIGRNRREQERNPLAHGEMEAIHRAAEIVGDWRLTGCDLYVTLEPCPMCMGAVLNARIRRVIFGAEDFQTGCCGSALDLTPLKGYPMPEMIPGFLELDCKELLRRFFASLR